MRAIPIRNFERRLQRLEQQTTGFTEAVMRLVCGAHDELWQRALESAGVSATVRDEVAQAQVQAFAAACARFRFPLPDEETLERFVDHETRPCEIVLHSALTAEERARFIEARTALYAELAPLTSGEELRPLYNAWCQRQGYDF
jgi:hypothetical protein